MQSDAASLTSSPAAATLARFDRATIEAAPGRLLQDGRWANARVTQVQIAGIIWVVKDFAPRAFLVRNTIGRLLSSRELRALRQLSGIDGISREAFRVDEHAIAARYIAGALLGSVSADRLTAAFFRRLERLLDQVHARGIVHLDTRGIGNVLITPEGSPALIDFQAALDTRWMPARWRLWFNRLDMSGVYKRWLLHDPQSIDAERRASYQRMTRWRKLWVLRGYGRVGKRATGRAATQPPDGAASTR